MPSYPALPASLAPPSKTGRWALGYIMPSVSLIKFATDHNLFPEGEEPHGSGIGTRVINYINWVLKPKDKRFQRKLMLDFVDITLAGEDPLRSLTHGIINQRALTIADTFSDNPATLEPAPPRKFKRRCRLLQSVLNQDEPPQWFPCDRSE